MAQILIADTAALDRIAKLETKLALAMAVVEAARDAYALLNSGIARFDNGVEHNGMNEGDHMAYQVIDALQQALAGLEG